MRQKVIIIGHGYTSRLGIIRSLSVLDCEITVIAIVFRSWLGRFVRFQLGNPIDCHSKYVNKVFTCRGGDEEGLIKLLLNRCTDSQQKVIIIPDSDYSAAVVDKYQELLKESFLFPHILNSPGKVEYWMDKSTQKNLAKSVGMNVAGGNVIRTSNQSYDLPEGLKYPCFTKPLATINGGKRYLKKCDDERALRAILDKFSQNFNSEILVEEFKRIDTEYAVVGFSDGNRVILPGIIKFIENSRSHFGIAREGMILPVSGFESLLKQFESFVLQVGFCGLFDIDFYESDGKFFFSELNLRFGGSGYAYTAMGVNLPVMYVRSAQNEEIENMQKEVTGEASYVNERMCMDDYLQNYITEKEFRAIIAQRDIRFIYDESDPVPYRQMNREFRILKMKRLRLQIIRKLLRRS